MPIELILSEVEPFASVPDSLVLDEFITTETAEDAFADVFWRFDEEGSEFQYLGTGVVGKTLSVPIELQGKPIILSLVARKDSNFAVDNPKLGRQITFTPDPKGRLAGPLGIAAEDLAEGDFINIYQDGSDTKIRQADALLEFEANAFILQSFAADEEVYSAEFNGLNDRLAGLGIGDVFLGEDGAATNTPPTASGAIVQQIGTAVSATTVNFEPQPSVKII